MAATCSYNGVSFNSLYHSSVRSRPILDEAGRTTVYVEHTLTIDGFVHNTTDATAATTMEDLRRRLTAPGGQLIYEDKGFGSLTVNQGEVRDVAWGPIPELLEWMPLGGEGVAAKVTWRVSTKLPECVAAKYQMTLMSHTYECTFSIDGDNYTSVSVSGSIEIPMTRSVITSRRMPDMVDAYRKKLESLPPLGWKRKDQSYHISKDKRRLDYKYTDEEIPAPFMSETSHIDARQSVTGRIATAFQIYTLTLDATIRLARGYARARALDRFFTLLGSRLRHILKAKGPKGGPVMLPQMLRCEEDIFGRDSRFSFSATIFVSTTIAKLMAQSGMWRPLTDPNVWRSSLQKVGATGPFGYAEAQMEKTDDVILDLCQAPKPIDIVPRVAPPAPAPPPADPPAEGGVFQIVVANLRPDNAWVDFKAKWEWDEDAGVVRHKLLAADGDAAGVRAGRAGALSTIPINERPLDAAGSAASLRGAVGAPGPGSGNDGLPADVVQKRTSPTRTITLYGRGVRIGYRVPVPRLLTVGGTKVVEEYRTVVEDEPMSYGSLSIFRTRWAITYIVPDAPRGPLPHLGNPVHGTDGGRGQSVAVPSAI